MPACVSVTYCMCCRNGLSKTCVPSDLIMLHPQDRPRRTLNSEGYPWLAPRAPSAAPHGRRAPRVLAGPAYRRSARVLSPRSAATALASRIESSSSGLRWFYRRGGGVQVWMSLESRTSCRDRELRDWALLHRSSPRVLLSKTARWPCPGRLCGLQNTLCRLGCELAACKTLGSPKPEADPPGCPFEE